jgi:lipoprotein LprG
MHHLRAIAALVATLLLLAACTPGGPVATPTPTPTPAELAASIGRATAQATSLGFDVTVAGPPVYTDSSRLFALTAMDGAVKRPDGVLATLKLQSAAGLTEVRTVSTGGRQYLTNPLTRAWQCVEPGQLFDPATLFEPGQGFEALLQDGLQNVTLVGEEQLGGRANIHLRGTLDAARLQAISGGLLGAGPVQTDVWADKQTLRASRLTLVDTPAGGEPVTWTLTFDGYDEPVDVRAPIEC